MKQYIGLARTFCIIIIEGEGAPLIARFLSRVDSGTSHGTSLGT
jgi:hypothetical protein